MSADPTPGALGEPKTIHPVALLSPRRLDLVCKYLYFRQLVASADDPAGTTEAARFYRQHIARRTGGVEPPDPWRERPEPVRKHSLDDHEREARALLESLRTRGFDAAEAVTCFADGTLGNGAHRIAAALALDMPVVARTGTGSGTAWGFNWFVREGFATADLQRLLYTYTRLKPDAVAVFVCYGPARAYWDRFTQRIAEACYLVGQVEVEAPSPLAMYEMVNDLYASLEGRRGVIHRKGLLLAAAVPLAVRVLVAERRDARDDVNAVASALKQACRQDARDAVPPESYLSIHASSSRMEALNMAGVLLSPNNWRQLGRRRTPGARRELLRWIGECGAACRRAGIAIDDICVVGSSPLEVVGVRPSTDLDFTLKRHYRTARYGEGVTHLAPAIDIVTAGYHKSHERPAIRDNELIDNPDHHFMFRGLKFANPEVVLEHKAFYRRDKDVRDVEAAGAVLAADAPAAFDPAFELALSTEVELRAAAGEPPAAAAATDALRRLRRRLWRLLAAVKRRLARR